MEKGHRITTMQSLLRVPHKIMPGRGKKVRFGQLLVETKYTKTNFAKEAATAILYQAELTNKELTYTPNGDAFVTRIERDENILEIGGDITGYLQIPLKNTSSFQVSFREATAEDTTNRVIETVGFGPTYVLTLSTSSPFAGELGKEEFWGHLGNNLYIGLTNPGPENSGRAGDPDARFTIVYGNKESYKVVLGEKQGDL